MSLDVGRRVVSGSERAVEQGSIVLFAGLRVQCSGSLLSICNQRSGP